MNMWLRSARALKGSPNPARTRDRLTLPEPQFNLEPKPEISSPPHNE